MSRDSSEIILLRWFGSQNHYYQSVLGSNAFKCTVSVKSISPLNKYALAHFFWQQWHELTLLLDGQNWDKKCRLWHLKPNLWPPKEKVVRYKQHDRIFNTVRKPQGWKSGLLSDVKICLMSYGFLAAVVKGLVISSEKWFPSFQSCTHSCLREPSGVKWSETKLQESA